MASVPEDILNRSGTLLGIEVHSAGNRLLSIPSIGVMYVVGGINYFGGLYMSGYHMLGKTKKMIDLALSGQTFCRRW